jgi:hypothetical protein
MGAYSRHLPVLSVSDQSAIVGGLQVRIRCEQFNQWCYPGYNYQLPGSPGQVPAIENALAQRLSPLPSEWPADPEGYLLIAIHSVKLLPTLRQQPFRSFQIFWNLLDSIVSAQSEATQELMGGRADIQVSHATKYNLGGSDATKQKARVRTSAAAIEMLS